MSYVFDASSILALTRELEDRVIDVMKGNLTANLAVYEIGNALWKECNLLKRLSTTEVANTLNFILALLDILQVLDVKTSRLGSEVLTNAVKLNITYYDSVYLTMAEKVKGILVTDDEKLTAVSKKSGVRTLGSKELVQKFK